MQFLGISHMKVFARPDEIHHKAGYTLEAHFETVSKDLTQHIRRHDITTCPCISSERPSCSFYLQRGVNLHVGSSLVGYALDGLALFLPLSCFRYILYFQKVLAPKYKKFIRVEKVYLVC
jgi:hypothetical protein